MKIYFCGSIAGGRQDADLYARLIEKLKCYGEVLTEIVGRNDVDEIEKQLTTKFIHDQDMSWLDSSDVVIAEVTQPSLGVGYEIGRAVAMKKKILCLYRPSNGKRLSAMIDGADGTLLTCRKYQEEEIPQIFEGFFSKPHTVLKTQDLKFS